MVGRYGRLMLSACEHRDIDNDDDGDVLGEELRNRAGPKFAITLTTTRGTD